MRCITASVYNTPEKLAAAIRKTHEATKNPFAVNITIGMTKNIDDMFEACFAEKVPHIETAAYKPDDNASASRNQEFHGFTRQQLSTVADMQKNWVLMQSSLWGLTGMALKT